MQEYANKYVLICILFFIINNPGDYNRLGALNLDVGMSLKRHLIKYAGICKRVCAHLHIIFHNKHNPGDYNRLGAFNLDVGISYID